MLLLAYMRAGAVPTVQPLFMLCTTPSKPSKRLVASYPEIVSPHTAISAGLGEPGSGL